MDRNGHAIGDHVEHRRAGARLFDDFAQLVYRRVARDLEVRADLLVAVPDVVGQAENAAQVDVALERDSTLRRVTPRAAAMFAMPAVR
jgi:hypothetical protein